VEGMVKKTGLNRGAARVYIEAYALKQGLDRVVLGGGKTDETGRFKLSLRVPMDSQLGQYMLRFKISEGR
ncbi:MAG: hypothetical protein VYA30_15585, partial [Myxococcota bacterium]|nr:hypothetical protein [Myxococcota bacterium]